MELHNHNRKIRTFAASALGCWLLVANPLGARGVQEPGQPSSDTKGSADSTNTNAKAKKDKGAATPTDPKKTKPAPEGYRIGVDDSLFISVWKEPDMSGQVTVRPDGVITLPLVNDVPVVGLTPKELQDVLTEKLKPFVNEPQVTVIVRDIKSRKVYLVGQVGKQGSVPLGGNTSLMELLASAGGLGPFAKSEAIYVLRNQDGHQVRIPFHYKKVLKGTAPDVALLPGDMIVVP
jgi:polysaccharide biosynthesis/export protein